MRRTKSMWSVVPAAAALATLLVAAGCGDVEVKAKPDDNKAAKPAKVDTSAGEGNWLLGLATAGGADAETSTTVYITYNPTSGQATAQKMPAVQAASASPGQAALLVSADRRWAIPDTGISRTQEKNGRLKVYSLADGAVKVVDIRDRTGKNDVDPIGWAFDPERADTLRVVDTRNRVWAVNVAGGKAIAEPSLPKGPWEFTNGFNTDTGEPWVESIESDATRPPGNLPVDKVPATRNGGTVLPSGSPGLAKLPASPCRLGAGYTDDAGVTWAFCADTASLATYYLPKDGKEWTAYGKPSTPVAPVAAGFPLVLPPAE
jgi:hypothetical protein